MNSFDALKNGVDVLTARGYTNSAINNISVDAEGNPVPWFSYPATDYLRGLNLKNKIIFEYGSGCSTLFFADICKEITSVESNEPWYERVAAIAPANCKIRLRKDEIGYLNTIDEDAQLYDVIIIDGAFNRRKMAEKSIPSLAPGGFIILDNSDCHVRAAKVLHAANLIQVDMNGFCPGNLHEQATTFFFKRDFNFEPIAEWQPVKTPWNMRHFVEE